MTNTEYNISSLQGHAHNYQRTYPISYNTTNPSSPIIENTNNDTYQKPTGEIFLTVGTGGESLHEFVGYKPPYIAAGQDTLVWLSESEIHG